MNTDVIRYLVLYIIPDRRYRDAKSISCVSSTFRGLFKEFLRVRGLAGHLPKEVEKSASGRSWRRTKITYGLTQYDHFLYSIGSYRWQTIHTELPGGYSLNLMYDDTASEPTAERIVIVDKDEKVVLKHEFKDGPIATLAPIDRIYQKIIKISQNPPNIARKLLVSKLW